ncbi:hypothetical protein BCR35DRAFT_299937 [Leucosporidium creatinivorum]|uniref:Uncharacterized protein n=1 Tax=Leucosporidium creatinivorum TaxID=106004 RepID=A0A1Y2G164_9BASI|nr:hypothetical protein BCR35DRAFT_299937 [Leucosporidium creatinivorum]
MSFSKLTPELLKVIAIEVRAEDQEALAALVQVNRTLRTICFPLLYQQPRIQDHRALGGWMKTIEAWSGQGGHRQLPRMLELTIEHIARPSGAKCKECGDKGHKTEHHSGSLCVVLQHVPPYHFHQLRTLSIFDSEVPAETLALLLGPLAPLRQTIQDLALVNCGLEQKHSYAYLFLHLHFVITSTVTDKRSGAQLAPSNPIRPAAISDWEVFQHLKIVPTGIPATQGLAFAQTPTVYSYSALTRLRLKILALNELKGDDLILIFSTNLFSKLKTLELTGKPTGWVWQEAEHFGVMRSVHKHRNHPNASFRPPKLTGIPPSTPPARLWQTLSPAEIASLAFTAYRGPSLVVLDMSKLTLPLVAA